MKLAEITGTAEKLGIVISSPAQVIAIHSNDAAADSTDKEPAFTGEEIEVTMIDFTTGKETPLLRKIALKKIRQTAALGNLSTNKKVSLIEICDGSNLELNANKVVRINLTGLKAANVYKVFAIQTNADSLSPVEYEKMVISTGVNTQRFPISRTSQLIMPQANLSDLRIIWSNGKEQRLTVEELEIIRTCNTTLSENISEFIIDCVDEVKNTEITEIEVNLYASVGYEILKVKNLNKFGISREI